MFRVNESTAEIFIYDDIGPDWMGMISDSMVVEALTLFDGQRAKVRINSPGGDVFIGNSIGNAIARHNGGVDTAVDGIAASIAASIAIRGETVTIAENGMFMLHHPWTVVIGNAADLRKRADDLDEVAKTIINEMANKTGADRATIVELMDGETFLDAEGSKEIGLADTIGLSMVSTKDVGASMQHYKAKWGKDKRVSDAVLEAENAPMRTAALLRSRLNRAKMGGVR